MNILCKIFGHRLYFDTVDIFGSSHCVRWGCNYKESAVKLPQIPMPTVKAPKIDNKPISVDSD